jgi:RNA polymerase sigma-70 factor (ECF subfamily)
MTLNDERALLKRAQSTANGFGELFDAYYDRIYAYAYRRVGSRDQAQDIAATVFEDALKSIKRLRWQNKPLAAWLYKIASRRVVDSYRSARSDEPLSDWSAPSDGLTHSMERDEEFAAVRGAMSRLNASDRELIQLVYFDEIDRAEIAALQNCTPNNVYVRLHRALKKLEGLLQNEQIH